MRPNWGPIWAQIRPNSGPIWGQAVAKIGPVSGHKRPVTEAVLGPHFGQIFPGQLQDLAFTPPPQEFSRPRGRFPVGFGCPFKVRQKTCGCLEKAKTLCSTETCDVKIDCRLVFVSLPVLTFATFVSTQSEIPEQELQRRS